MAINFPSFAMSITETGDTTKEYRILEKIVTTERNTNKPEKQYFTHLSQYVPK
jgi:hypothetical protein